MLKVDINMLDISRRDCPDVIALEPAKMLICHCERVNDRRIREVVEAGAKTVGQVGRACRAGTCCGGCARAIAEIVEEADSRATVHRLKTDGGAPRPLPVAAE